MIIPEFIQYYGYTVEQAMSEYAKTFYSLVNDMYRLKARDALMVAQGVAIGMGNEQALKSLEKQERGLSGFIREVKLVRKLRK